MQRYTTKEEAWLEYDELLRQMFFRFETVEMEKICFIHKLLESYKQ